MIDGREVRVDLVTLVSASHIAVSVDGKEVGRNVFRLLGEKVCFDLDGRAMVGRVRPRPFHGISVGPDERL